MSDSGPDGYLRALDDDFDGALELVVRDLVTAGCDRAVARSLVWRTAGTMIFFGDPSTGGELALRVVDELRADIIENRPDHVWPACRDHPNHPLWIDVEDADAPWVCPTTGRRAARLGELGSLAGRPPAAPPPTQR